MTILLQFLWNTICHINAIGTKERTEYKVQNFSFYGTNSLSGGNGRFLIFIHHIHEFEYIAVCPQSVVGSHKFGWSSSPYVSCLAFERTKATVSYTSLDKILHDIGFWLLYCFFSLIGPDTTHIRIVFTHVDYVRLCV